MNPTFLISGCFFSFRESLENPASLSRYSMERLFWSAYPADENHLISLSCWWKSSDQLILLMRIIWSAFPADENLLISLSCLWETSDQLILLMKIIWISLSCWWESSESADTAFKKTRLFKCQLILPDDNLLKSADPGWWNCFGDYWSFLLIVFWFSWSSLMMLGWSS
jgi:hypothetical protein